MHHKERKELKAHIEELKAKRTELEDNDGDHVQIACLSIKINNAEDEYKPSFMPQNVIISKYQK